MSVEMWSLVWGGLLLFVLIVLSANANVSAMGMGWGIGNRDQAATTTGWGARARRAYLNHIENLLIYACFAIPLVMAGARSSPSVPGAQIFIIARVLSAILYVPGLTVARVRTTACFPGVVPSPLPFLALLPATM